MYGMSVCVCVCVHVVIVLLLISTYVCAAASSAYIIMHSTIVVLHVLYTYIMHLYM